MASEPRILTRGHKTDFWMKVILATAGIMTTPDSTYRVNTHQEYCARPTSGLVRNSSRRHSYVVAVLAHCDTRQRRGLKRLTVLVSTSLSAPYVPSDAGTASLHFASLSSYFELQSVYREGLASCFSSTETGTPSSLGVAQYKTGPLCPGFTVTKKLSNPACPA